VSKIAEIRERHEYYKRTGFRERDLDPVVLVDDSAFLLDLVARQHEAIAEFRAWADGYKNPTTGMGAGLHCEMWPSLSPSAQSRMLDIASEALLEESQP